MFVLTNTPKEFIPSTEKDQENPLTFIVKPPTKKAVLDMQEQIFKSLGDADTVSTSDIPLSAMMNLYLETCVIGWKNVVDENGDEIEFTLSNFDNFYDSTILIELYNYCRELTESTEKN